MTPNQIRSVFGKYRFLSFANLTSIRTAHRLILKDKISNHSTNYCLPGARLILRREMASDSKTDFVVEHSPDQLKFFIRLGNDEAKLEYAKNGDILNMWHTEVPSALQGKGIAKILAQAAFDYAVKNNLKMLLTCTYLQKFYHENPKEEYKRLVV